MELNTVNYIILKMTPLVMMNDDPFDHDLKMSVATMMMK